MCSSVLHGCVLPPSVACGATWLCPCITESEHIAPASREEIESISIPLLQVSDDMKRGRAGESGGRLALSGLVRCGSVGRAYTPRRLVALTWMKQHRFVRRIGWALASRHPY